MKKLTLGIIIFLSVASFSFAQKKKARVASSPLSGDVVRRYTDSLSVLKHYYDSVWTYQNKDVLKNPYYFRLFFQPTLYDNAVNQAMDNDWRAKYGLQKQGYNFMDLRDKQLSRDSSMNQIFANLYVANPELITITEEQLKSNEGIREEAITNTPIEHEVSLADRVKPAEPVEVAEPVKVVANHRPNFWKVSSRFTMQYMQNYSSDNWYQGSVSNNSFMATIYTEANYNYNEKIKFSNSLDARLGFQTVRSDSVHKYHPTTDLLRVINKFELRALKNWYYSTTLTSWTQMSPMYADNSNNVLSDFMSPFESTLGVGMTYNFTSKKKSLAFVATLSPLALDVKYVDRKDLETRYGLDANHQFKVTYGSTATLNWTWKLLKELSWTSRLYYFTNYKKVQSEWENTFNFTINKYLSTIFFLYPRFDDTEKDSQGRHRVQFKQYLSLGFNYAF